MSNTRKADAAQPDPTPDPRADAVALLEGTGLFPVNALTLAAMIGDPVGSHPLAAGKSLNDKRVRSIARDRVARFVERTSRMTHAYTADEALTIAQAAGSSGSSVAANNSDALRAALAKGGRS